MQPDGQPSAPPTLPPAPGSLRALRTLPVDDIGDEILELIYIYTQLYYQVKCRKQNVKAEDFVDEHQFIANVRQQESEFFEVFGKAMKANEDGDDMIAFLNHSTCLCCGMNQD
jgi:hypothetical protein